MTVSGAGLYRVTMSSTLPATRLSAVTALLSRLEAIVGRANVLKDGRVESFTQGYREGGGEAVAVVKPGNLVEFWQAAEACVDAGAVVIAQAANTGLTGGSTPRGAYDRPVVIINTLRLRGVRLIRGGDQAICQAGASLIDLEDSLRPVGREPHSVIGSSCIGASVVGGVCNNSGGALIRRGPAYTEYALYAEVAEDGRLRLRNRLGVKLPEAPEPMLRALEEGWFSDDDVIDDGRSASAAETYEDIVRDVDDATPARFNADPSRLFEASGSAGKVIVFAVRVDAFPATSATRVFYVGTNQPEVFTRLRRRFLQAADPLPISAEYIHREAFDLADRYGRDTSAAVRWLGARRLTVLNEVKRRVDRAARRLGAAPVADRCLQALGRCLPSPLSSRLHAFEIRFEHHLILSVEGEAAPEAERLLREVTTDADADMMLCSAQEARQAMLHRFAVAGAAVRRRAVDSRKVGDIIALDIALPRNTLDWFETLPPEIEAQLEGKLYYGHFFCHVFHQDYLVKPGVDVKRLKARLLELIDARGAEYPAEHNVGHAYDAKPALRDHYRRIDPTNALNPGLGGTSRRRDWA